MQSEAPDQAQRYAICQAHWNEGPKSVSASLGFTDQPHVLVLRSADAALPIGAQRTEGGQPVRRFRKTLIREGSFHKPADGLAFSVAGHHLDHWAKTFYAMKNAGVRVPVPAGHTTDPEKNRGWLVDCFREGDKLVGIVDLIGEDGIALAGRSDVSIYAAPKFTDGKGNQYEWPILHVALCTDPVIPGLGGFEPLAASLGGQKPIVLVLENQAMPEATPAAAAPAAGVDPAEAVVTAITEKVVALVKDKNQTPVQKKAAFGELMKKLEKALGVFEEAKAEEPAAAKPEGAAPPVAASLAPSPILMRLHKENIELKLDNLVREGKCTPAQKTKFVAGYLNEKALALSLSSGDTSAVDTALAVLAEGQAIKLGEHTGQQVKAVALSNAFNAGGNGQKPEIVKYMETVAGVPQAKA